VFEVSRKAKETFVMFNNHGSPAIKNAARLRQITGQKAEGADVS